MKGKSFEIIVSLRQLHNWPWCFKLWFFIEGVFGFTFASIGGLIDESQCSHRRCLEWSGWFVSKDVPLIFWVSLTLGIALNISSRYTLMAYAVDKWWNLAIGLWRRFQCFEVSSSKISMGSARHRIGSWISTWTSAASLLRILKETNSLQLLDR